MLRNSINGEVYQMPKAPLADLNEVLDGIPLAEIATMRNEIGQWADAVDDGRSDFFVPTWQTGKNWTIYKDGLFDPLLKACDEMGLADPVGYAGLMLGWLIRQVVATRTGEWLFYKNPEVSNHGEEAQGSVWGTYYWRLDRTASGCASLRPVECVAP